MATIERRIEALGGSDVDGAFERGWNEALQEAMPIGAAADEEISALRELLFAILSEETLDVHVGYEHDMTSGAYLYADAVRTDSDAFLAARRYLSPTPKTAGG